MTPMDRPISPHLGIWRWSLAMALSIAHRATGMINALAALLLVYGLVAIASGPDSFGGFRDLLGGIPGRLVLFGVTLSLMLHLATGVRHLVMDTGRLLEPGANRRAGLLAIFAALALTLGLWVAGYHFAGRL